MRSNLVYVLASTVLLIFIMTSMGVVSAESIVDETEITSLIHNMGDQNISIRVDAVKGLVEIGYPAVDPLIQVLNDNNPKIQENSAAALGKIGAEKAVQPLIELLADDNDDVQRAAKLALCDLGDPAVEPLIEVISDGDTNWLVLSNGMRVLETIGDERAVHPLINMLGGSDGVDAAVALGEIGEPAVQPLIDVLKDSDPRVRAYAVRALGRTGDSRAVEPVIELLNDEDENVRSNAAMALGKLADRRAINPLTKASKDKSERVRTLTRSAIDDIERQYNSYQSLTFYGNTRDFYTEDERRSWLEELKNLGNMGSEMSKYMYPDGPVISHGYGYDGYISVTFLEGSEVNESLMDEIYKIIDQKALRSGIKDVSVKFEFEGMPIADEAPTEDITTLNTPGFTSFSLVIVLLFVLRKQKRFNL